VPIVTYNIASDPKVAPNPTVNILQASPALAGLVWMSSIRNKVAIFGSSEGDFTYTVSTVIVAIVIIQNLITN